MQLEKNSVSRKWSSIDPSWLEANTRAMGERDYINSSGDLDETHPCISGDQIPNFTKLKLLIFSRLYSFNFGKFFFFFK